MIALLDPRFILPGKVALERPLKLLRTSSDLRICIPKELWAHIAPQDQRDPAIDTLRRWPSRAEPFGPQPEGRVWGFKALFGHLPGWAEIMSRLALRFCAQEKVILLSCRTVGQDVVRHQTAQVRLDEPKRWRLYAQPKGVSSPKAIPCVEVSRHLELPWTGRYHASLPDSGRYPFAPPLRWWKRDTEAVKTIESKPAFVDHAGRGWVPPNTPGAPHHWDVFVTNPNEEAWLGLSQLNVVAHGAPASEGQPGEIHHVPEEKKSRFHDRGWRALT